MASTARAAETLTVPEAARVLGIGRTLAYQLMARYLAGEPGGLPAMKLGHCVRVPRKAIDALLNGDVPQSTVAPEPTARELAPAASAEGGAVPRPSGRAAKSGRVQLSLLEGR